MKKIYLLLTLSILLSSCSDWLDVNKDPDSPSEVSSKLLFTAAVGSSSTVIGGQYAILGSLWGQHLTQSNTANQYKDLERYNVTSSTMNSEYTKLYAMSLYDLKQVLKRTETAGDWNLYLMATVMDVYIYQILADLYGEIPYFEACRFDEGINKPKFDNGEDVYADLIARLDNALSKDFTASTNTSVGSADLVFSGNISNWVAFANTLKLKIALRQFNVKPTESAAIINTMLNSGVSFLTVDAKNANYVDDSGRFNPFYDSEVSGLGDPNLRASNTTLNFLLANNDTRLPYMYQLGNKGSYLGLDQGDFSASTTTYPNGSLSKAVIKSTDPVIFINTAESEFLQAEALVRCKAGAGAKEKYDAGVKKAFSRFGLDGSAFIAAGGLYEYDDTSDNARIESIITQKWLSFFLYQGLEAFFEFNRTGYPLNFTVSKASVLTVNDEAVFVRRLVYPEVEKTTNPNTPAQVNPEVKLWWAK